MLNVNTPLFAGNGGKRIRAYRTEEPVRLDGVLDEAAWQRGAVLSDFTQREPDVDQPASERTEVRVLVTEKALYLGVHCYDSDPAGIIARERRRDHRLSDDDRFEIVIDTFHDHRNAYYFVTNPLGTRRDALITDEGRDINAEWDERWQVESRITDRGWTLEVRIPLSTLRAPRDLDVWGINFLRFIRRKNEIAQWTGWSRDYTFAQVSQAGHLDGMRGVRAGIKARIQPYLLAGVRRPPSDRSKQGVEGVYEAGLEVAKLGLTPSLVADFTLNTDFAQVEVDEAVVNLTRFSLFFPERREFFLERAGIFDFSLGGRRGGGTDLMLQMFFSRRIGLTPDRRPLPILGGAKVIGRLGDFDLGVLNVQTDDFEGAPGSNYTVFRLKRNILERSNIGVFLSNRQSGQANDYNRVAGAEMNLTLFEHLDLHGSLGRSFTPGSEAGQGMGRFKLNWWEDRFEVFAEHLHIGDDFRHDIGFVRRTGIRRSDGVFVWEPRPRVFNVRRLSIRNEIVYLTDTGNRLLTREQIFQLSSHFHRGDTFRFNTTDRFEQLDEGFGITEQVTIPGGGYGFRDYSLEYRSPPQWTVTALTRFGWGEFYSGRRKFLRFSPAFKPRPEFSAEIGYEYNDVELPQGSFTTHVANTRFNLNLSRRVLMTAQLQYDSESGRMVLFFRLRFNYRPGDDLFIVYNESNELGRFSNASHRVFAVKFTRSFDF